MATTNSVAAADLSEDLRRIEEEERQGEAQGRLTYCYEEIKNLLWIENSPVHKRALEEWERKTNLFTARVVERQKQQSGDLRNEIYNLVGFFSVFQGVLLTATSQSNLLHCNNAWSPISLSTLASVVTIAGVWQKFRVIEDLEKTIYEEGRALKVAVHRSSQLRQHAADFRFYRVDELPRKELPEKSLLTYKVLVVLSLLAFSGLFFASHGRILCDWD